MTDATASKLVLKFAQPTGETNAEGNAVYGKYQTIGEVKSGVSKKGTKFLMAKDSAGNTYYVSNAKKVGPKHPKKILTVLEPGAEESAIVCGLFEKVSARDGARSLAGKNRDTNIKYAIFTDNGERKELANATSADLF